MVFFRKYRGNLHILSLYNKIIQNNYTLRNLGDGTYFIRFCLLGYILLLGKWLAGVLIVCADS